MKQSNKRKSCSASRTCQKSYSASWNHTGVIWWRNKNNSHRNKPNHFHFMITWVMNTPSFISNHAGQQILVSTLSPLPSTHTHTHAHTYTHTNLLPLQTPHAKTHSHKLSPPYQAHTHNAIYLFTDLRMTQFAARLRNVDGTQALPLSIPSRMRPQPTVL
jgi:hypothetical protein